MWCPPLALAAVRDLAPPGDLTSAASKPLPFEFKAVEMQYDSYRGMQVRCRWVGAPGQAAPVMVVCGGALWGTWPAAPYGFLLSGSPRVHLKKRTPHT